MRRGAGVVERGGLENRCALAYPGFESLSLRHFPLLQAVVLSKSMPLTLQRMGADPVNV